MNKKKFFFAWNEYRRWENGFPTIFEKKKIFKVGTWKSVKGEYWQKKIFFAWNESRRWEIKFPTIFEKKKFLRLPRENPSMGEGGSIDQKKFFLLEINLEDEKMDFPPFSKKKNF